MIEAIVAERNQRGDFTSLRDFIERMTGKDVNKKAIENFIKAGAFDELPGNRRQKMMVYAQILDAIVQEKVLSPLLISGGRIAIPILRLDKI